LIIEKDGNFTNNGQEPKCHACLLSPVVGAGKLNISSKDTDINQGEDYSNDMEAMEDTAGNKRGKVVVVLYWSIGSTQTSLKRNPVDDVMALFYSKDAPAKNYNRSDYMFDEDTSLVDVDEYLYDTESEENCMDIL
jgi:hypothetical protein